MTEKESALVSQILAKTTEAVEEIWIMLLSYNFIVDQCTNGTRHTERFITFQIRKRMQQRMKLDLTEKHMASLLWQSRCDRRELLFVWLFCRDHGIRV